MILYAAHDDKVYFVSISHPGSGIDHIKNYSSSLLLDIGEIVRIKLEITCLWRALLLQNICNRYNAKKFLLMHFIFTVNIK